MFLDGWYRPLMKYIQETIWILSGRSYFNSSKGLGGLSVALSMCVYFHDQLPTAWDGLTLLLEKKSTSPTFYLFKTFSLFFCQGSQSICGGSLYRNIWRLFHSFSSSAWLGASASRHENMRMTTKVRATENDGGGKVSEPPLL